MKITIGKSFSQKDYSNKNNIKLNIILFILLITCSLLLMHSLVVKNFCREISTENIDKKEINEDSKGQDAEIKDEDINPKAENYYILHNVVAGDTVWDIANKYGISMEEIFEANDLPRARALRVGQVLTIPKKKE